VISVERAVVRGVEGDPKSVASRRDIDVPHVLVAMLREWKAASTYSRDEHHVFCTHEGKPDGSPNVTSRGLKMALKRAGIKKATGLHDLRHSYASSMLALGVPITRVAALLGHASPAVTLTIYAHVIPKYRDDAAAKLEAFITGVPAMSKSPTTNAPAMPPGTTNSEPRCDTFATPAPKSVRKSNRLVPKPLIGLMGRVGLEPTTNALKGRCSTD
jgi:Phage integrase family